LVLPERELSCGTVKVTSASLNSARLPFTIYPALFGRELSAYTNADVLKANEARRIVSEEQKTRALLLIILNKCVIEKSLLRIVKSIV
jgi:hypothetical protein